MKNLKLNVLASENLSRIEMNQVTGGCDDNKVCGCACAGVSSTRDNGNANYARGLCSSKIANKEWVVTP